MPHLQVDTTHRIYFSHSGNKEGESILYIHGGPGLGSSENDKTYFDLDEVNLIQYDQRGCGKSEPLGDLNNNDTQRLIDDILKILNHLRINEVILFGGSWGSTLSLLFGIMHPERVKGMVLRGIFTASKAEREHFEEGGTALFFPDEWKRFKKQVPANKGKKISPYYFQNILSDNIELRNKLAFELMHYGISLSRKDNFSPSEIAEMLANRDCESYAMVLSHYSIHDFFIPDRFILNNLEKLADIPIRIVQGRYDMITPPKIAIQIAHQLENVSLNLVDGGHSPSEDCLKKELQSEVKKLVNSFS